MKQNNYNLESLQENLDSIDPEGWSGKHALSFGSQFAVIMTELNHIKDDVKEMKDILKNNDKRNDERYVLLWKFEELRKNVFELKNEHLVTLDKKISSITCGLDDVMRKFFLAFIIFLVLVVLSLVIRPELFRFLG